MSEEEEEEEEKEEEDDAVMDHARGEERERIPEIYALIC